MEQRSRRLTSGPDLADAGNRVVSLPERSLADGAGDKAIFEPSRGDSLKIRGYVKLELYDKGRLVRVIEGSNLVTTAGKNAFTHRMAGDGSPPAPPTHIAFGTDGSAPTEAQTALLAESAVLGRTALSLLRGGNTITYLALPVGGASNVTVLEIGLFNAAVAGVMYARFLPQTFIFQTTMAVGVSWTLTVG